MATFEPSKKWSVVLRGPFWTRRDFREISALKSGDSIDTKGAEPGNGYARLK